MLEIFNEDTHQGVALDFSKSHTSQIHGHNCSLNPRFMQTIEEMLITARISASAFTASISLHSLAV